MNGEQESHHFAAKSMIFVPMGTLLNIVAEGEASCITFHFLPSVHLWALTSTEMYAGEEVPRASKEEELPAPRFT